MTSANRIPAERVYSAERDAIIKRDWPAGVPWPEVWARIEALPGPMPSGRRALMQRAKALGVSRPPNWSNEPRRSCVDGYSPWPHDRLNLCVELFRNSAMASAAILDRLNGDFPHLRPVSWKAVQQKMMKRGVKRQWVRHLPAGRQPRKETRFIAMDQPKQPGIPASLPERMDKAARMLAGKGRDFHVWSIVAHTGLEAWQVCMVAGRVAMGLPLR